MTLRAPYRAIAHDTTAGLLTTSWWAGDLFDGTRHHKGVGSWDLLIEWLRILRDRGIVIRELQLWCHGYEQGPVFDGKLPTEMHWREIHEACPHLELLWLRACDVGRSPRRVARIVELLHCTVVCHCVVISAGERKLPRWLGWLPWKLLPAPWHQGRIVALRPGETPWWDPSDSDLRGCLVTDMQVPAHAYRPGS